MHILSRVDVKKILLYFLIFLFAYSISGAVFNIMAERTIGSIFRHLMTTTPYLLLIILVSMYDVGRFSFSSIVPTLPTKINLDLILKRYFWITILAFLVGIYSVYKLVHLGELYVPVIIAVFISLLFSCYYMMGRKSLFGIIIFLMSIPFLYFLQMNYKELGFEELVISNVRIPFSAIYLLIMVIALLFGRNNLPELPDVEEKKIVKVITIFVFVSFFSVLFSKIPDQSLVFYILDLVIPFIFFLIIYRSIQTIKDMENFLFFFVISVTIYQFFSLYFIYQKGTIEDVTIGYRGSQLVSGYFTGFNARVIPLMMPFQITLYKLLRGWKKLSIGLSLLFFLIYLFLSNDRTALVGVFIGLFVFIYYYRIPLGRKIYLSIIGVLCLVIITLYLSGFFELIGWHRIYSTIKGLWLGGTLAVFSSSRVWIWQSALEMIRDFPIFGIGPDMWSEYIPQYSHTQYFSKNIFGEWVRYHSVDPHNLYFLNWVNYGIVSFICYIIILFMVAKMGIKNIKKATLVSNRNFLLASLIALIVWISMSIFTMDFFSHYNYPVMLNAIVFWSIIAIIVKLNGIKLASMTQIAD